VFPIRPGHRREESSENGEIAGERMGTSARSSPACEFIKCGSNGRCGGTYRL
jgi:hypothetical protein